MKMFKEGKSKKLILILVFLILFSFCCPKQVKAFDLDLKIEYGIVKLIYDVVDGIMKAINDIFVSESAVDDYDNVIYLSPESVIKGKFALMDANIFKKVDGNSGYYDVSSSDSDIAEGKNILRNVISGWYYALRNLAIVALLSILVYVAIRMTLSTISQDKAKYKTMLKDWAVALCLVFVLHYIMVATFNITDYILSAIGTEGNSVNMTENLREQIDENLETMADIIDQWGTSAADREEFSDAIKVVSSSVAMEVIILVYIVIFAIKYLIRAIILIFLILMAPITCITYPIDKIGDGKAQAFNRWFQEFFYNVIIQPFHLLIYVVLVGAAIELAQANIIYCIMCFAVMIPAEKLVREMFGFKDKLGSPLGAMATGAIGSQLLSKIKSGGGSSGSQNKNQTQDTSNVEGPKQRLPMPGADANGNNASTGGSENSQLSDGDGENPENAQLNAGNGDEENFGDAQLNAGNGDEENSENPQLSDVQNEEEESENPQLNAGNDDSGEGTQTDNQQNTISGMQAAVNAVRARRYSNRMQKYGNTKFGGGIRQIAGRAGKGVARGAGKMARGAVRGTIKGATTLTGAAVLGLAGAAIGKGTAGAALGATLGSRVGGAITNKTDALMNNAGEYIKTGHDGFWENQKKQKEKDFKGNANNIKLAKANYKNRTGKDLVDQKLLEKEMDDMWKMDECGINRENFNDVLSQRDGYLAEGIGEEEAFGTAVQSAYYAQSISNVKDFYDESYMSKRMEEIKSYYGNSAQGDKMARKILTGAGKIKGANRVSLPNINRTVDVPITQQVPSLMGIEGLDSNQTERLTNITIRMQNAGYDKNSITRLASSLKDNGTADEIIEKFAVNVDYLTNSKAQAEAAQMLNVKQSNPKVKTEMINRNATRNLTGKTDEKTITKLRKQEVKLSDKGLKGARDLYENATTVEDLKQELIASGLSQERAEKESKDAEKLSKQYK